MKMHNNDKIHFIGVGGASLSALAKLMYMRGKKVTGSDRERSAVTHELGKLFPVHIGENPSLVLGCDLVVFSSAVKEDNLELKEARRQGIPTLERHQFLGEIAEEFERTVAVGGTHGKTTVTALLTHALNKLDAYFTAHVGGETEYGNLVTKGGDIFVTEACEYKRSLLSLNPHISVVLNAECDHPDCYQDLKSVLAVFLTFLSQGEIQVFSTDFVGVCSNGHMTINDNEKWTILDKGKTQCQKMGKRGESGVIVSSNGKVDILTYKNFGTPKMNSLADEKLCCDENEKHLLKVCDNKILADDDKALTDENKKSAFENNAPAYTGKVLVYENGVYVTAVKPYDDNQSTPENILFALAVLKVLGYDYDESGKALESFGGVKRRNEFVGKIDGARVVFDYAHHPTQIRGILSSQRGKTMVVFQPHTYSRTKAYFDEFCSSLAEAHTLVIMGTYGARESASDGVDSDALAHAISTKFAEQDVYGVLSFDKTLDFVISRAKDHDNVLFLGAGDIYLLKDMLTPFLDKPR